MSENIENTILSLDLAKKLTKERLLQFPMYGPYMHAMDQIDFIEEVIARNRSPSEQEKNFVDITLMAIKELDSSEPAYAEALCEVSFWFKKM